MKGLKSRIDHCKLQIEARNHRAVRESAFPSFNAMVVLDFQSPASTSPFANAPASLSLAYRARTCSARGPAARRRKDPHRRDQAGPHRLHQPINPRTAIRATRSACGRRCTSRSRPVRRASGPRRRRGASPYIQVENEDNDDVGTIYRTPFRMEPNEERWVMSYAKPGKMSDIKIKVVHRRPGAATAACRPVQFARSEHAPLRQPGRAHPRLADGAARACRRAGRAEPQATAGHSRTTCAALRRLSKRDAEQLPEHWFGYQGVDLLFLSTRDKEFLLQLAKDNDDSRAASGRWPSGCAAAAGSFIGVAAQNARCAAQVPDNRRVWQPPLPVVPPKEGVVRERSNSPSIENFAGRQRQAMRRRNGLTSSPRSIRPRCCPGAWEVLARPDERTGRQAAIARMPYGLGSITLPRVFALDEPPFTTWATGKADVPQGTVVKRLRPARRQRQSDQDMQPAAACRRSCPPTCERQLDNFDVTRHPLRLRRAVHRPVHPRRRPARLSSCSSTSSNASNGPGSPSRPWCSRVSVAAYFTAYALKGNDLKINKVDIVDFDLRTELDAKGQPTQASPTGRRFFTILSPRIQNYTIGVEPNPAFWGGRSADKPRQRRPGELAGPARRGRSGGMGRARLGRASSASPTLTPSDAAGLRRRADPGVDDQVVHARPGSMP